jgi:hypothetical protein
MSGILSANPAVRKREEDLRVQARLKVIDAKVGQLLAEVGASPSSPPDFTDEDVSEVGRWLVEGRVRLPSHVRITVTTTVEDVRHALFNTTAQLIQHEVDQVCTKLLRPLTVLEALNKGLLRRVPDGWGWSEAAYERLSNAR